MGIIPEGHLKFWEVRELERERHERYRHLYEMKQNAQANEPWDVDEIYVPEWVLRLCDWFQARKKVRWERKQQ